MKKFSQLFIYCCIFFLASCSSEKQEIQPSVTVTDLNEGSTQILHDIAAQNIAFSQAISRRQMMYKRDVDMEAFIKRVKSGELNLNDRASALLLFKEISWTPEIYADYVNNLYKSSKKLIALNKDLLKDKRFDLEKSISVNLTNESQAILKEQANQPKINTYYYDSNTGYTYWDGKGDPNDVQSFQNLSSDGGGGGGNVDALGDCSQALSVALSRCLDSFALKMAAAAALSEAVAPAIGIILEAIAENYVCKEYAYQDFDNCARSAGFFRH